MRLAIVLCCLLTLAPAARAGGLNLAWDACLPDGGTSIRKSACNSNAGYNYLFGSFTPLQSHPRCAAVAFYVDIQSESSTLPAWWGFFWSDLCRSTALNVSFDFSSLSQASCNDPYNGSGWGGIANYMAGSHTRTDYTPRANAARIMMGAGSAAGPTPVSAGTEYYGFRISISNMMTTGAGACDGCATPVCVTLSEADVYDDVPEGTPQKFERLTAQAQSNMVSWQDAGPSCQSAVKNKTWGQLKSMYR